MTLILMPVNVSYSRDVMFVPITARRSEYEAPYLYMQVYTMSAS